MHARHDRHCFSSACCIRAVEGAAPTFLDLASRILTRLRPLAEVRQVRIERTLHGDLALADCALDAPEPPLAAQSTKLGVRIEYERGPPKGSRNARAVRVQPDDEVRVAAEAEGEHRIVGVVADARIPAGVGIVVLVQALQLRPQSRLEGELRARRTIGKHGDERAQLHRIVIARAELRQLRGERACGGTRAERRIGANDVSMLVHHALPDQTREAGIVHEAREFPLDLGCADHVGNPSGLGLDVVIRRVPGGTDHPANAR